MAVFTLLDRTSRIRDKLVVRRFGFRTLGFIRSIGSLRALQILHLPHVFLFHCRSLLRMAQFHLLLALLAEVLLLRLFMFPLLLRLQLSMLRVLAIHQC